MRKSVALSQAFHASIKEEIAERTAAHQQRLQLIKQTQETVKVLGLAESEPLVLLAHGDSWFDYPLSGNDLSLDDTDVIAQLRSMGTVKPQILNISHFGDATSDELGLPKQERLLEALQEPNNWMASGKPNAILFSGGGNDIAGDKFCIFLDPHRAGTTGLDVNRFQGALAMVAASYLDLFAFRDQHAIGVPVIGHCYDIPLPTGVHPVCAGPWLQPSLTYCGWDSEVDGPVIVKQALVTFKTMLTALAANPDNNFKLIDTQGVLTPDEWANELHPFPQGFQKIAEKFIDELRSIFPNRI